MKKIILITAVVGFFGGEMAFAMSPFYKKMAEGVVAPQKKHHTSGHHMGRGPGLHVVVTPSTNGHSFGAGKGLGASIMGHSKRKHHQPSIGRGHGLAVALED